MLSMSSMIFGADYKVMGKIVDSTGEGEAFATLRIYAENDTVKPVVVATTDVNGVIDQKLNRGGVYNMKIHSVGKEEIVKVFTLTETEPVAQLGTIEAKTSATALQEVEVVAQRPLVTREIDRIGYDVQADEESKTTTVIEMLRKVPMVSVDADNTIKVNGSTNFVIYKNGRPNKTFSGNPKEVLAAIPASMIKRIEVITEPGAKYDAEGVGAILNIITNEDTSINGVMGNINLNTDTRSDFIPSPFVWVMSQLDKVAFSAYGGYSYVSKKATNYDLTSVYDYKESGSKLMSDAEGDNKGGIIPFGLELSYDIDTMNLITAEMSGYYFDVDVTQARNTTMKDNLGNIVYSYGTDFNFPRYGYLDLSGGVNYQRLTKRKGETLTMSYLISTTRQKRDEETKYFDAVNMQVPYTGINSKFDLYFMEHTFQFDWTRPIKNIHTIDAGVKYIYRDNHSQNTQNYIGYKSTYTDFSHITNIAAVYGDYRLKLGKFGARAGIRYEYSHLKAKFNDGTNPDFGQNLNDWVPSAGLSWNVNDANSLTLNYATRINRPGISYLNPVSESTPTGESSGNPNLESSRYSSIKLSYMLIKPKFNLNTSLSYDFSDNMITSYKYVKDDYIYSTYKNIGKSQNLKLNIYAQWTITPKTQFMLNGNINYFNNEVSDNELKLDKWGWGGYARLTQTLPWNIKASVDCFKSSVYLNGVYSYSNSDTYYYGISLSRNFLKEDRLSVTLRYDNPFGPDESKYITRVVNGDYVGEELQSVKYRSYFGVRIGYRFGSVKTQVKKTAKTIENDDLIGRKK